jgi:high-affinity nickel-transport protein
MRSLPNDVSGDVRARIFSIYGFLLVFNVGTWLWAMIAFRHYPVLLGQPFSLIALVCGMQ